MFIKKIRIREYRIIILFGFIKFVRKKLNQNTNISKTNKVYYVIDSSYPKSWNKDLYLKNKNS